METKEDEIIDPEIMDMDLAELERYHKWLTRELLICDAAEEAGISNDKARLVLEHWERYEVRTIRSQAIN